MKLVNMCKKSNEMRLANKYSPYVLAVLTIKSLKMTLPKIAATVDWKFWPNFWSSADNVARVA